MQFDNIIEEEYCRKWGERCNTHFYTSHFVIGKCRFSSQRGLLVFDHGSTFDMNISEWDRKAGNTLCGASLWLLTHPNLLVLHMGGWDFICGEILEARKNS